MDGLARNVGLAGDAEPDQAKAGAAAEAGADAPWGGKAWEQRGGPAGGMQDGVDSLIDDIADGRAAPPLVRKAAFPPAERLSGPSARPAEGSGAGSSRAGMEGSAQAGTQGSGGVRMFTSSQVGAHTFLCVSFDLQAHDYPAGASCSCVYAHFQA